MMRTLMTHDAGKSILILFLLLAIFTSCEKRYKMKNRLGEEIDITSLVRDKHYKPIYCKGKIYRLINPEPFAISSIDSQYIKKLITDRHGGRSNNTDSFYNTVNVHYLYSYTIFGSLADDVLAVDIPKEDTIERHYIVYDGERDIRYERFPPVTDECILTEPEKY